MSDGYEAVLGALAAHARQLDAVADEIRGLTDQAATKLSSDSLGEIGQPFTALVDQLVTVGNRAVDSGAKALNAIATGIAHSGEALPQPETGHGRALEAPVADNITALSAPMRPVDALSAAGLGQLTGLVAPLQSVLDRMAGDASGVYAFLDAWVTVSSRITQIQARLAREVTTGTASWRGEAADQYRMRADDIDRSLAEFAAAAREAAAVVQLAAEVVGQSRAGANDLITDMVRRLISLVRHLMAVEGGMTATVLAQAGDLVSTFAKPVANIERQAQTSLANAVKPVNDLITAMGTIARLWDSYAQGDGPAAGRQLRTADLLAHELAHVIQRREGR
ncbi:hypothetical protein ALI144C_35180 [Actinosynnema sp. ALI-1.44]|uniref:type VII secretion target n=1 Tax=Actinosynnema sp. ALI-1.44 TaxID=1933779 RepID=UPI00097C1379|nr:hypothetical protein [Actinosynnema sp. ALI-1.44]ONI77301.1 hypothetical protein ALI144C_35180 [Actinosynnema sp. ALI-1.44]